ncbi:MAG: hypothetical protein ACK4NY_16975 [Spirosomataceae bacterium]
MTYTCGIVEDELLSERMLRGYLKRFPFLEIAWVCSYAEEALDFIEKEKVNLLILDLQSVPIHQESAFYSLVSHQRCVIVTSVFPTQMVNVPLDVVSFLNKPFSIETFSQAVERFIEIVDD